MTIEPEVWLRGSVDGVPAELLPTAHAFLQTLEDVSHAAAGLTQDQLWRTPGGAPSVGFHLLHLDGSTDRLLTYARGERLSPDQKAALAAEQAPSPLDAASLIAKLRMRIEATVAALREVPVPTLYEGRTVGRAALPTTVIGLLFHAAEHSQRHAGQVVTTAKIVRGLDAGEG
ncbi:MAG: DinB family protein [Vicinamibacterales bacterium]